MYVGKGCAKILRHTLFKTSCHLIPQEILIFLKLLLKLVGQLYPDITRYLVTMHTMSITDYKQMKAGSSQ